MSTAQRPWKKPKQDRVVSQPSLIDRDAVRSFIAEIHAAAARACDGIEHPGVLQLTRGHPLDNDLVVCGRFQIGDVKEMTDAAISAAEAGHNVYVEPRTIQREAPKRGKGEEHTHAVFGLVIDRDGYSNKVGNEVAAPTWRVQTSPGSAHEWFLFEKAVAYAEAKALGIKLRCAAQADTNSGVATQPYRVAGTPNYPSPKKIALGRETCGTYFQNSGPIYSAQQLSDLIGDVGPLAAEPFDIPSLEQERTGVVDEYVENLVAATEWPSSDRSNAFAYATKCAVEAGMTAGDFEDLCRANPQGFVQKYLPPESSDRLRKKILEIWAPHAAEVADRDAFGASIVEGLLRSDRANRLAGFIFESELPSEPPPALIKGLLPKRGIAFVGGQSGAGKTFVIVDLAMALVSEQPFFGHEVKERVGVVILAAEGADTFGVRLETARVARDIKGKLPIALRREISNLSNDREIDRLCTELGALNEHMQKTFGVRLGVILIDTVAASFF